MHNPAQAAIALCPLGWPHPPNQTRFTGQAKLTAIYVAGCIARCMHPASDNSHSALPRLRTSSPALLPTASQPWVGKQLLCGLHLLLGLGADSGQELLSCCGHHTGPVDLRQLAQHHDV